MLANVGNWLFWIYIGAALLTFGAVTLVGESASMKFSVRTLVMACAVGLLAIANVSDRLPAHEALLIAIAALAFLLIAASLVAQSRRTTV